jgi:hypothetical protein
MEMHKWMKMMVYLTLQICHLLLVVEGMEEIGEAEEDHVVEVELVELGKTRNLANNEDFILISILSQEIRNQIGSVE